MSDTTENLVLDLIEWPVRKEPTQAETMDAWRRSCPRLPVREKVKGGTGFPAPPDRQFSSFFNQSPAVVGPVATVSVCSAMV